MWDSDYSVIKSDIIKRFDCKLHNSKTIDYISQLWPPWLSDQFRLHLNLNVALDPKLQCFLKVKEDLS